MVYVVYAIHPSVAGFYKVGRVVADSYDAAWESAYGLALHRGFMPDTVKIIRECLPGF